MNEIRLKIKRNFGLLIFKKDVLIFNIAKKLRNFNFLFITENTSSINSINSCRNNLIFIKEALLSIEIAEIPIIVKLELIRRLITRDNSRLSSLNLR